MTLCGLALYTQVHAQDNYPCSNPDAPCQSEQYTFEDYELSFRLPKKLVWLKTYQSDTFYAILLKSVEAKTDAGKCQYISESKRLAVQAQFPEHKVFASHNGCNDISPDMVTYTNVNSDYNFLAVYAGQTRKEAERRLSTVEKQGQFSGPNIRKMQVELYYGD